RPRSDSAVLDIRCGRRGGCRLGRARRAGLRARSSALARLPPPPAGDLDRGLRPRRDPVSMSPLVARAVEHVHRPLGSLSAAALCPPAILLRQPRRRALAATVGATILVTAVAVLGAVLYPEYRASVKPALFASAPVAGNLFERKEHLGVATLV